MTDKNRTDGAPMNVNPSGYSSKTIDYSDVIRRLRGGDREDTFKRPTQINPNNRPR